MCKDLRTLDRLVPYYTRTEVGPTSVGRSVVSEVGTLRRLKLCAHA